MIFLLLQVKLNYSYHFFNKSENFLINISVRGTHSQHLEIRKESFLHACIMTDEAKACKKNPFWFGTRRTDFRYWLWYRHSLSGKMFSSSAKQGSGFPTTHDKFTPAWRTCLHSYLKGTQGCYQVAQDTSASLPSCQAWQLASLPNLSGRSWHAWKRSLTIDNDFNVYISYSYLTKCRIQGRGETQNLQYLLEKVFLERTYPAIVQKR